MPFWIRSSICSHVRNISRPITACSVRPLKMKFLLKRSIVTLSPFGKPRWTTWPAARVIEIALLMPTGWPLISSATSTPPFVEETTWSTGLGVRASITVTLSPRPRSFAHVRARSSARSATSTRKMCFAPTKLATSPHIAPIGP